MISSLKLLTKVAQRLQKKNIRVATFFLLDNIWLGLNNFFVIDANISVVPKDFMIL